MRLDLFLVNKKLVESRARAKMEIEAGNVLVNGVQCLKSAYEVKDKDLVSMQDKLKWVSRGGLKLEKALQEFKVDVMNKTVLDIGSSTGGFSDVVLTYGANQVYCVDTGRDILHNKIRSNKKVKVFEQTDYRNLDISLLEEINLIVIDVSFISLEKIIEKLSKDFSGKDVEIISLIKPQFEVGKTLAKKYKGVIRDTKLHQEVIDRIILAFKNSDFNNYGVIKSPVLGGDGNTEFLAYFKTKIKD